MGRHARTWFVQAARVAGISVVATQLLGGVGPLNNYNLSPEIIELGNTPVAVICSGFGMMDIPKTMEVLETQGVNLCAHRQPTLAGGIKTDSGYKCPLHSDSVAEISKFIYTSSGSGSCVSRGTSG